MWSFWRKKEKPNPTPKTTPTPEEVMNRTGMSEEELTRLFMMHLIQEGKNPFLAFPEPQRQEAIDKYPDIADLARKRFGNF